MLELNKLYLLDCMDLMKGFPDKYFQLAIVDPPYGINISNNMGRKKGDKPSNYKKVLWDSEPPSAEFFKELFRVSQNQIIWGGNYFQTSINCNSRCWIVWDKLNGDNDFADCELAWTSFDSSVRIFRFRWAGMLQGDMKNKELRIHPTQKPVALYKWLLTHYAHKGDKILDTHVGSASSLVACHELGFDYIGSELDPDYFKLATERLETAKAQQSLFLMDDTETQSELPI